MRRLLCPLFLVLLAATAACSEKAGSSADHREMSAPSAPTPPATVADGTGLVDTDAASRAGFVGFDHSKGGDNSLLDQASMSRTISEAVGRKIIRNGEMTLEVEDAATAQQKVAAIAEQLGGFVVTSEISQYSGNSPQVTITMRVPAEHFGDAGARLHAVGSKVLHEKETGQDVTEEFIDVEARLRSKQALEAQFLEIMKQAKTVSDALEVQGQLADVRTEIERLEGRRRFLENQSSLSTITVILQVPSPIVASSGEGFGYHLRRALGDAIDTASAIVIGFIRFVGVAIPVLLLIVLPLGLLLRMLWRRIARKAEARRQNATPPPTPPFVHQPAEGAAPEAM